MISIDYRGLREVNGRFARVPADTREAIRTAVIEATELVYQQARSNVESMFRNPGKIESTLKMTIEQFGNYTRGRVSTSGIGAIHELGTRTAYDIFPRGQALRFFGEHGVAFAAHVHHPPIPERSFLRLALDQKRSEIQALFGDAIRTKVATP